MKLKKGESDYSMFVNENSDDIEGGFEWKFLDHKPKDRRNYQEILITFAVRLD